MVKKTASEPSPNRHIWDAVEQTDPRYTKKVTLGRSFTAIDPYRQIERATEVFGPVGEGWGYDIVRSFVTDATNQYVVEVRMWHGNPENAFMQCGQAGLFIDRKQERPDADFAKKAVTDAVTKCLSILGFNADIFLGKFEDNKYVQEMEQKFEGEEKATEQKDKRSSNALTFANDLVEILKQTERLEEKLEAILKRAVPLKTIRNYPDCVLIIEEAINAYVLSQYKQVLGRVSDRDAFYTLLETWQPLRLAITDISPRLRDDMVVIEDELSSSYPSTDVKE